MLTEDVLLWGVGSVQAFVLLFLMQQALKELMSRGLLGDIIFKCSLLMD